MAYSFGATIGDKLGRIQTDTSGLDEARKVGGGIRRAVGDVLGAWRAGKVEDEAQKAKVTGEENKAKVQAIVQEYNNQVSPEYEGMTPSQRALKVSRLLYPLDQSMSQRYEDYARSIQQTQGKYEQEQKVADTKVEARAGELATKNAEAQALKSEQDKALVELQEATKVWQTNPDDAGYQNMVRDAVNNAKRLKLNPENPIDDFLKEKYAGASLQGTEAQREFQRQQALKDEQFRREQAGKGEEARSKEDELKKANQYKTEADELADGYSKIIAAKGLLAKDIGAGASALASKFLQGDVLAEAEIARYISGSELDQFKNKIRESVGLRPDVQKARVVELINTMIDRYNAKLDQYNRALGSNQYKKNYERIPRITSSGTPQPAKRKIKETDNMGDF